VNQLLARRMLLIAQIAYLHHLKGQHHSQSTVSKIRALEVKIEAELGIEYNEGESGHGRAIH
jgi:hypothetical protein